MNDDGIVIDCEELEELWFEHRSSGICLELWSDMFLECAAILDKQDITRLRDLCIFILENHSFEEQS